MKFSIRLLMFLFVIFAAIDHLSAQDCETVYVDSTPVQDSTGKVSLFAWNTLSDERPDPASTECYYAPYPQPYTHSYYNSVQITSPSGRTITEYGWGNMQGGNGEGIVEADAELDLGCSPSDQNYPDDCEVGTYSVDGPEDSVYCSAMGADFFEGGGGFSLPFEFEIANTKHQTNFSDPGTNVVVLSDGTVRCELKTWCTAATSPPACNPAYVDQHPIVPGSPSNTCAAYYNTYWLAERPSSSQLWDCFPIPPGNNAFGTSDPSLGVCKK